MSKRGRFGLPVFKTETESVEAARKRQGIPTYAEVRKKLIALVRDPNYIPIPELPNSDYNRPVRPVSLKRRLIIFNLIRIPLEPKRTPFV